MIGGFKSCGLHCTSFSSCMQCQCQMKIAQWYSVHCKIWWWHTFRLAYTDPDIKYNDHVCTSSCSEQPCSPNHAHLVTNLLLSAFLASTHRSEPKLPSRPEIKMRVALRKPIHVRIGSSLSMAK